MKIRVEIGIEREEREATLVRIANRGRLGEQITREIYVGGELVGIVTKTAHMGYHKRGFTACYALLRAGEEYGEYENLREAVGVAIRGHEKAKRLGREF